MLSVVNIMKRNCSGMVLKSLCTQSNLTGSRCLSPFLQKDNFLSLHASATVGSTWSSKITADKKSILLHSQSHKLLSRSMSADHSHSRIWTMERFLSAGLIGLLPLSLVYPNPAFDYALALALTIHVHWGIEAIVVDYVRPNVVGAALSRAALAGVYALSVLTLGGLFYFNYSDVGLSQAIRMLWKL